jgi:hypothetical protein
VVKYGSKYGAQFHSTNVSNNITKGSFKSREDAFSWLDQNYWAGIVDDYTLYWIIWANMPKQADNSDVWRFPRFNHPVYEINDPRKIFTFTDNDDQIISRIRPEGKDFSILASLYGENGIALSTMSNEVRDTVIASTQARANDRAFTSRHIPPTLPSAPRPVAAVAAVSPAATSATTPPFATATAPPVATAAAPPVTTTTAAAAAAISTNASASDQQPMNNTNDDDNSDVERNSQELSQLSLEDDAPRVTKRQKNKTATEPVLEVIMNNNAMDQINANVTDNDDDDDKSDGSPDLLDGNSDLGSVDDLPPQSQTTPRGLVFGLVPKFITPGDIKHLLLPCFDNQDDLFTITFCAWNYWNYCYLVTCDPSTSHLQMIDTYLVDQHTILGHSFEYKLLTLNDWSLLCRSPLSPGQQHADTFADNDTVRWVKRNCPKDRDVELMKALEIANSVDDILNAFMKINTLPKPTTQLQPDLDPNNSTTDGTAQFP